MLETTDNICQLCSSDVENDGINCQLSNDDICQLLDEDNNGCQLCDEGDNDCQLWDDDDDTDEESLYELERDEYYENVLAPQLNTLNRR